MTIPAPAPTTPADVADLADLAGALRRAARLPGLLVHITPDLGDNACAVTRKCDPAPLVEIGTDLLADHRSTVLQGAMAHEIAHHTLKHGYRPVCWRNPAWLAKACFLAGLIAHLPLPVLGVLAVAVFITAAMGARRERLQEYDADAHAVRLLDAAGLPGRRIVAAALADLPDEPPAYRLAGWVFSSHPTSRARRRTLAAGRPARRLRWALIWQHIPATATATATTAGKPGVRA
ncbi:M48 family metallopeptidase [Streptosporangium sp. NBC_01639]|uniref:M48 family metalloprotease n=1 Tax=Streptosporangium sp. NBC_01639 TaxID=2975948 RepID=UPI003868DBF0|nr:M48 family metallopeptidase [Streptosporangium sp. NBC_01639]